MRAAVRQQLNPSIRSNESAQLGQALKAKIVGQEEGVQALVDLFQVFSVRLQFAGPSCRQPAFLGPTGSGKTGSWKRRRKFCLAIPGQSSKWIARNSSIRMKSRN